MALVNLFLWAVASFFVAALLGGVGSAFEAGIAPPVLELEGTEGELLCGNVSVFGVAGQQYRVSDAWAGKAGKSSRDRDIRAYQYPASALRLSVMHSRVAVISEEGRTDAQVCVSGRAAGRYAGALLFRAEDANIGVGTWLDVRLQESQEGQSVMPRQNAASGELESFAVLALGVMNVLLGGGLLVSYLVTTLVNKKGFYREEHSEQEGE